MGLLNNFLIYIIFLILFQLLVEVKPQDLRNSHTATLIDNKLYIIGGAGDGKYPPSPTFFYLNVSESFDTNGLKWHDLTNINNIPPFKYAAATKGGANNKILFLYGGIGLNNESLNNLVYTFDTQNNILLTPTVTGIPPNGKVSITSVIDYNGLIYLFGGHSKELNIYTNDMFILDSINLSCKNVSSINAPSPRVEYGAVFLPNKNIIYIGGYNENVGVFALNEVYLYNTINDTWTTQKTYGSIPSARYSISSVLSLDNQKIIIYGGYGPTLLQSINPENSLYVLNISNFNWYIPKVGKMPPTRAFHKSVLIENYMVITFGKGYTQETDKDILLLDISNDNEYIWKTSFDLGKNNSTSKTSPIPPGTSILPSPDSEKANIIIGAIIGSTIGIAVTLGSFFLYKRKKHTKKQDGKPSTSQNIKDDKILHISSEKDNNNDNEILHIPSEKDSNNDKEILLIPSTTQLNSEKNEAISEVIVQNAQNAQKNEAK
ncbi:unnamed protein product [Rhizophagus irregularis]|nr:unnamed protein product [Rhizophagus irregularis]CAB5348566.1 unnamed protein product [Rhizophagus irregularis]